MIQIIAMEKERVDIGNATEEVINESVLTDICDSLFTAIEKIETYLH